jgi:class 3 adenylate cyclase
MALRKLNKKYVSLLLSVIEFETNWAYYSMSSGNIYQKEVKNAAKYMVKHIDEVSKFDPQVIDKDVIENLEVKVFIKDKMETVNNFLELKKWAEGNSIIPYTTFWQSKFFIAPCLSSLKWYLAKKLGILLEPHMVFTSQEIDHAEKYLRWKPHLPSLIMYHHTDDFDETILSKSRTIVVYGDIRSSQDLMTYTVDNEYFEQKMIDFFTITRSLIDEYYGIFDKFTGDGFLAYFNEDICKLGNKDFIDCFINFSKKYIKETLPLFKEWKRNVRKIPEKEIMVSLGADIGKIYFGDYNGHLICIGDAIVWAERMCSSSLAGEVFINNILANTLADRINIKLSPSSGVTKSGESFRASKIEFI